MLIPVIISLVVLWFSLLGLAMSAIVMNSAGIFWYSIGVMISGVALKVFLRR